MKKYGGHGHKQVVEVFYPFKHYGMLDNVLAGQRKGGWERTFFNEKWNGRKDDR